MLDLFDEMIRQSVQETHCQLFYLFADTDTQFPTRKFSLYFFWYIKDLGGVWVFWRQYTSALQNWVRYLGIRQFSKVIIIFLINFSHTTTTTVLLWRTKTGLLCVEYSVEWTRFLFLLEDDFSSLATSNEVTDFKRFMVFFLDTTTRGYVTSCWVFRRLGNRGLKFLPL